MSPRVLMVAWHYYPSNASGSHRPAKLAKYLPEFGWTPVVLCANWTPENRKDCYDPLLAARPDVCQVVRVPHAAPRRWKPFRAGRWLSSWLLPYHTPIRGLGRMLSAGRALLAKEPVDAVWSTFRPGINHTVAAKLAREKNLPWMADFRDLPDQSDDTWQSRLSVRRESSICRSARALVAVAPDLAVRLADRHDSPVHTITNGFDPADYSQGAPGRPERFDILYTGILYEFRNPRVLFDALDHLIEQDLIELGDVRLKFYGSFEPKIRAWSQGHRCAECIEVLDRVPHTEIVRIQQQAGVLLNLKSPGGGGSIPAKLFDYLAAGRPILNIPGDDGVVDRIIAETEAGITSGELSVLADALLTWYREWKQTGTVSFHGRPEVIAKYSWRELAKQLAGLLDSIA